MSAGFLCNNPIFLLHSLLTLSWMGDLEKIYSTWYLRFLLISCQLLSWSAYLVPIQKFSFHFSLTRNAQLWINARTGGCYKCCGHIIWGGHWKTLKSVLSTLQGLRRSVFWLSGSFYSLNWYYLSFDYNLSSAPTNVVFQPDKL